MSIQKTNLKIEGMTCGHCSGFVTRVLKDMKGVTEAKVDLQEKAAEVMFDDELVTKQELIEEVNKTGIYQASVK